MTSKDAAIIVMRINSARSRGVSMISLSGKIKQIVSAILIASRAILLGAPSDDGFGQTMGEDCSSSCGSVNAAAQKSNGARPHAKNARRSFRQGGLPTLSAIVCSNPARSR